MRFFNDDQEDILLSLTIALILISYFGIQIFGGGLNFIGLRNSSIPELLINFSYYILLILCIPIVISRFTIDMLCVFLFFFISLFISYVFFPDNQLYIEMYFKNLINIFPAFFIARSIRNSEIFLKILYKTAYLLLFLGIIYFLFYSMKEINRNKGYDMVFGYELCIGVLFLLNKYIKEKNIYDFIFSLTGIIMILIRGSRGPVLVIGVFLIIKFLFSQYNTTKKILYLFSLLLIVSLAIIYKENILELMINILEKFNIYSRSLVYFLSNNTESLQERQLISNIIIKKIIDFNPLGYGVFSDRVFLQGIGPYTHNFVLEILLDFGWIIGSLVLYTIGLLIFNAFKNKNWSNLVVIFVSYVFVELMFTNSYLVLSYFWIMLGILLNASSFKGR